MEPNDTTNSQRSTGLNVKTLTKPRPTTQKSSTSYRSTSSESSVDFFVEDQLSVSSPCHAFRMHSTSSSAMLPSRLWRWKARNKETPRRISTTSFPVVQDRFSVFGLQNNDTVSGIDQLQLPIEPNHSKNSENSTRSAITQHDSTEPDTVTPATTSLFNSKSTDISSSSDRKNNTVIHNGSPQPTQAEQSSSAEMQEYCLDSEKVYLDVLELSQDLASLSRDERELVLEKLIEQHSLPSCDSDIIKSVFELVESLNDSEAVNTCSAEPKNTIDPVEVQQKLDVTPERESEKFIAQDHCIESFTKSQHISNNNAVYDNCTASCSSASLAPGNIRESSKIQHGNGRDWEYEGLITPDETPTTQVTTATVSQPELERNIAR